MNSSKKIILTGATGLIGKEVLPLLKKEGFEVLALSSKTCNLFNKTESISFLLNKLQVI